MNKAAHAVVAAVGAYPAACRSWPSSVPDTALRGFALRETISHCERALRVVRNTRNTPQRSIQYLESASHEACRAAEEWETAEQARADALETARNVELREELLAEAELLTSSPGRAARRRLREIRLQWRDTYVSDHKVHKQQQRRFR